MRFSPKTEQEVAEAGLWPAGEVDFEILEAEDTVSKSGNDMVKLKIKVFNEVGDSRIIFDYLLEAVAYKLRHCAEACDLLANYNEGCLDASDFIGKTGRLKLRITPAKDGYAAKNDIADYIVPRDQPEHVTPLRSSRTPAAAAIAAKFQATLDDDVPF